MSTVDIKSLIKNRGSVKRKLTILEKYVDNIKNGLITPESSDVKLRLDVNLNLFQEFDNVQTQIEQECDDNDLEMHASEREPFENKYYAAISFLTNYITNNTSLTNNVSSMVSHDPLQNFLLPKIKLPTFNGQYENWLEFKKNFSLTIDSNTNLNDCQKYNFLKASLEGYAKRSIEGCDQTQDYQRAWQMLNDKFNKKTFLVDTHIKSIFNINSMMKGTFSQFRNLLDEVSKHLSALDAMNITKDSLWDTIVIHIIYNKLDKITQNKWKEQNVSKDLPNLDEFLEFLKERSDILESLEEIHCRQDNGTNKISKNFVKSHINLSINAIKCNLCKRDHTIYVCNEFLKLSNKERWEKVKTLRLCSNCLRIGHSKDTCRLGSCRKCKRKHNTLLHFDENISSNNSNNSIQNYSSVQSASNENPNQEEQLKIKSNENIAGFSQVLNAFTGPCHTSVLLSTVTFNIEDIDGNMHKCRALLDCGAQSNLITEKFCKQANLNIIPTKLSIIGINQVISNLTKKTHVKIISKLNNFKSSLCCYITPTISSNIISQNLDISQLKIPENIPLSDPDFFKPGDIDMLLGASIFWDLLLDGRIKLNKNGPILQNTKFGWIVSGQLSSHSYSSVCNFSKTIIQEDEQLKKFWEINDIPQHTILSKDDHECEKLFIENTTRTSSGQFVVKLPLKESPYLLGDSKTQAIQRFNFLEKKFTSNPMFFQLYKEFIQEYIELDHMTLVTDINPKQPHYYFPHHGILKDSLTTKLRVVFDGSCASTSGWSLNDLQYIGPKVQNNIFDILIRFRYFQYVVSADITKMYRQILMNHEHRPLHLILWRESPDDSLSTYQLNTVTYGTTAAPYLAIKCLKQIGIDNNKQFPEASNSILKDFYVDDLLTGSNDLTELQIRCQVIDSLLKSSHFILRKWHSNCLKALVNINNSNFDSSVSNKTLALGETDISKILGIHWLGKQDLLKYKINFCPISNDVTKRKLLSVIAQIYDPLGLLGPVVIISKIIIQNLWTIKLEWDQPIPQNILIKWNQFYNQLHLLNDIDIPRHVIGNNSSLCDIHCFCDSSSVAYASCIYLRSINSSNTFSVQLLCSKTKVAPLKVLTIPRLELCAALLGAELMTQILNSLPAISVPIYFWSDSKIVLCWLKKQPSQLQMFVANRVAKIQSLTNINTWFYVNTKENPADLASRGILPEHFKNADLWWHGPQFLYHSIDNLVRIDHILDIEVPELKKSPNLVFLETDNPSQLFLRYSDLNKLQRITCYCLRFISNCRKKPEERKFGFISNSEMNSTFNKLLKLAQLDSFSEEITLLTKNKCLPAKHKFSSLSPFLDNNDIMRVGGRLKFTTLEVNVKHPILLSSKHPLTKLIFQWQHVKLLHAGPQLLLATIRQTFWPIGGRNLARKIVKNCLTCFKFNPSFASYPMSNLPDIRVKPSLPFQFTGIDFAGPFPLKNKIGRGSILIKCYICVFVCFSTKSIHLELVGNLSTECFLSCLKRFTSRRGLPSDIFSDNGSTFIGARNELSDLGRFLNDNQTDFVNYSNSNNIRWHFIPPYAANFGGLWESSVKSTKYHLKRLMLNKCLIYEEFNSLIIQIEGILNSRPLYSLSADPNDLNPITPSHFLIGRPIISLPDNDLTAIPTGRLSKLQEIQQMYQQFWIRFKKEYITQLHHRYKWKDPATPIQPGMLVLIKNTQHPPCKWPMGRILHLHPSKDGISRVATIKMPSGASIIRSVRHLCPIPLEEELLN